MLVCKTSTQATWYFNTGKLPANAYPLGKYLLHIVEAGNENTGVYQCTGMDRLTQQYFFSESHLRIMGKG